MKGLLIVGAIAAVSFPVLCQVKERDSSWLAPASASARASPLVDRQAFAAGGGKIYRSRCASCHGDDGSGTSRGPRLIDPVVQAQSDGALFWKISSGNSHAGMPSFSFLPEAQRWQLVIHLRALATQ